MEFSDLLLVGLFGFAAYAYMYPDSVPSFSSGSVSVSSPPFFDITKDITNNWDGSQTQIENTADGGSITRVLNVDKTSYVQRQPPVVDGKTALATIERYDAEGNYITPPQQDFSNMDMMMTM